MKMVSIQQTEDTLPALIREMEGGEKVIITRDGVPVAEIVPYKRKGGLDWEALRKWKEERGLSKAVFGPVAADFDDPLPEDFLLRPLP